MTVTAPPVVALRQFIAGSWEEGSGDFLISSNPARPREAVAEGQQATPADVNRAVTAAAAATRDWSRTPMHERGAVLLRAADHLTQRADSIGLELAREEGKTLIEARGEVTRAAQILRYYGNEGDRSAGEIFSSPRRGERILVTRKPLGVVGVVTSFNFPIAIPAWKIAPALVYGNTVVWKPAGTVPLQAIRLAEALHEAGLPAGVLNLLIGPGPIGTVLVEHPLIGGLTFTGSTGVGRRLAATAAAACVPIQAEMGGKNASIVLADADLDLATEQVLFGAFRSTGQKCTATSRLVVDERVADELLERLRARLDNWVVGDPTDPDVHMGPVISQTAAAGIRSGVKKAVEQGATRLYGGETNGGEDPSTGCFVPPALLQLPADPTTASHNTAWRDEIFGPVLTVRRVANTQEAFTLANESEFGLSASVFTQDITQVLDAVDEIDVGILHVNSESAGADPHVPFGGAKKSGYGPKEQGGAAKEFFTHTTTVYLRGGSTA